MRAGTRLSLSLAALLVGATAHLACSGGTDETAKTDSSTAGSDSSAAGGTSGSGGNGVASSGGSAIGGKGSGGDSTCPDEPPRLSAIAIRLDASDLEMASSPKVEMWASRGTSGPVATQGDEGRRPMFVHSEKDGISAVRFDGVDDSLSFEYPVAGRAELTIASLSRTYAYELGNYNKDCDFNKDGLVEVGRELNCSATDNALVAWNEKDNQFVGLGLFYNIGQEEVNFRVGTGEEYAFFKTPFILDQPNGDGWVSGIGRLRPGKVELRINGSVPNARRDYVDETRYPTVKVQTIDENGDTHPDWPQALGASEDLAWIGRGRFDDPGGHWPGELALLLVYEVALSDAEVEELSRYIQCRSSR